MSKRVRKAPPLLSPPDRNSPSLFDKLPIDLAQLILSFVDPRPRLCVLSFVSKRWRILVLRSVQSLPNLCIERLSAALRSLPSVTAMSLSYPSVTFKTLLPSTLRELRICSSSMHCACTSLTHISSLTVLSFIAHSCTHLETIIVNNAPTLERLIVHLEASPFHTSEHTALQALLVSTPFPVLHSLCMRGHLKHTGIFTETIFALRTQLKRLALDAFDKGSHFAKRMARIVFHFTSAY